MIVLLPFKGLMEAKSRWPELGLQRSELVLSLLAQNLHTVASVVGPDNVYLVTPDSTIRARFSQYRGVTVAQGGLNEDLEAARTLIAQTRPIERLSVVLPDLPTLSPDEVGQMLKRSRRCHVLLCPDSQKVGTNALVFSPGDCLDFGFEGASFARHQKAAGRRDLSVEVLQSDGLANDCDDLDDLRKFCLL